MKCETPENHWNEMQYNFYKIIEIKRKRILTKLFK